MDLDAYFQRIGYSGPATPTLDTLHALHYLHPQAIPFENLDLFIMRYVPLDAPTLEAKLIHGRRGGHCFEQNLLFADVLRAIGYKVRCLAARPQWNLVTDVVTPRAHMLLAVTVEDGTYIADVGTGSFTMLAPLKMETGLEQPTPHEPYRLIETGETIQVQVQVDGVWKPLCSFEMTEQQLVDYEIVNFFFAVNPLSYHRKNLSVIRADAKRRLTVENARFIVSEIGGPVEERALKSVEAVCDVLVREFRLTLPAPDALEPALSAMVAKYAAPAAD